MREDRQLLFENGRRFFGAGFGARADAVADVVFETAAAGYQELLSDPARCGQMVLMTYPLIGNSGLADEDYESRQPALSGLIVREVNEQPSNYRWTRTLPDWLEESGVPGIAGVDTRAVTRMLRTEGGGRALLTAADCPLDAGLACLRETPVASGLVAKVSCKKPWYARTANPRYTVAAVDLGISLGLVRRLNALGCNVTVVPHNMAAEQVLALRPDGVLLSDGPGNPGNAPEAVALVRALAGKLPVLGLGLGHLAAAMAFGASAVKARPGRHGANRPVKETATGRVQVARQDRDWAVDAATLTGGALAVTHTDGVDGAVLGLGSEALHLYTAQFRLGDAEGIGCGIVADPMARFIAAMDADKQREVRHA